MSEIVVWPDGTECELDELAEYLMFCSDDYMIIEREEESYETKTARKVFPFAPRSVDVRITYDDVTGGYM